MAVTGYTLAVVQHKVGVYMFGFHANSEQPISTIEFIGQLSVRFQAIIPIEIQAELNPNIRTLDWILTLRGTVWDIDCQS